MTLEEIKTLNSEQIATRKAEIKEELNKEDCDVNALSAEVDALEERANVIKAEAEQRANLVSKVNSGAGEVVERGETQMNENEERAQKLMDTGKMEVRALLSTGTIAKPTKVDGINGLPEAENSIVDDVHAVPLTGTGAYTVAYKDTEAAAADVTDGEAIGGTGATFKYVTINPAEWGVFDEISNQVKKVSPLAYETEVRNSALISLRTEAADKIVKAILASTLLGAVTVAIDKDYLRTLTLNFKAIPGKGAPKLYLNRSDLVKVGAIRGTNEKKALYEIAFDPGTTNSGTITEGGLAVKFAVIDSLAEGTQLFGQPQTVEMPMWDNYSIETDEGGEFFKTNMVGIRGIQTANADLCAKNGMVKVTNATA